MPENRYESGVLITTGGELLDFVPQDKLELLSRHVTVKSYEVRVLEEPLYCGRLTVEEKATIYANGHVIVAVIVDGYGAIRAGTPPEVEPQE